MEFNIEDTAHAQELLDRVLRFFREWVLHDKDGERYSEHEWMPLLKAHMDETSPEYNMFCEHCDQIGISGNQATNQCLECDAPLCSDHWDCELCL